MGKVTTLRISKEALSDHMDRLYYTPQNESGEWLHDAPHTHIDGDGFGTLQVLKRMKFVTLVMADEAAIKELLSDFDYYASLTADDCESDTLELAGKMRRAAESIKKQLNDIKKTLTEMGIK